MKPIDIVPLQEPNPSQFRVDLGAAVKRLLSAMGWKGKDRLIVYRQGAGIMLVKGSESLETQIAAMLKKKSSTKDEISDEKPKKGKGGKK